MHAGERGIGELDQATHTVDDGHAPGGSPENGLVKREGAIGLAQLGGALTHALLEGLLEFAQPGLGLEALFHLRFQTPAAAPAGRGRCRATRGSSGTRLGSTMAVVTEAMAVTTFT